MEVRKLSTADMLEKVLENQEEIEDRADDIELPNPPQFMLRELKN